MGKKNTFKKSATFGPQIAGTRIVRVPGETVQVEVPATDPRFESVVRRSRALFDPLLRDEPPEMGQVTDRVGLIVGIWAARLRDAMKAFLAKPLE